VRRVYFDSVPVRGADPDRRLQYKNRSESKLALTHFLCTTHRIPPHTSHLLKPSAPELPHALRNEHPDDPKPIYWRPCKLTRDQEDKLDEQREDTKQDLEDERAEFEKTLDRIGEEIKELKEKRDRALADFDREHPATQEGTGGAGADVDADMSPPAPVAASVQDEAAESGSPEPQKAQQAHGDDDAVEYCPSNIDLMCSRVRSDRRRLTGRKKACLPFRFSLPHSVRSTRYISPRISYFLLHIRSDAAHSLCLLTVARLPFLFLLCCFVCYPRYHFRSSLFCEIHSSESGFDTRDIVTTI
jgi:hypothetical protein